MAKFPVEYNKQDSNAVVDAVNYVLSGPSGLGQNFSGFSDYNTVYLTGNYRIPFTTFAISVNSRGGSGTNTVTVDSVTDIQSGYYVAGPGIASGATVVSIDPTTNIITLSAANTSTVSGQITFSPVSGAALYVAPITISTITWISPFVVQVNFASPQATPPFQPGNNPTVAGNSLSQYNTQYIGQGVIACTTTSVTLRTISPIAPFTPGTGSGGTITFTNTLEPPVGSALPPANIQGVFNNWVQTDCFGYATITGATDRAFISAQVDQLISYTATAASDLRITVAINRYTAKNINTVANPQLRYSFDATVAERVYLRTGLTGSGTLANIDTVFGTFIDNPTPGYYIYRLEFLFRVVNSTGSLQVTQDQIDVRTLSCQVVKQ